MNNQEDYGQNVYYNEVPAETNTSLVSLPEIAPITISKGSSRTVRKMEGRLEMDAAQERCKARLTQEVIVNTTALSAIADQAERAVPSCSKAVRNVVNVYAASSALRIAERW